MHMECDHDKASFEANLGKLANAKPSKANATTKDKDSGQVHAKAGANDNDPDDQLAANGQDKRKPTDSQ